MGSYEKVFVGQCRDRMRKCKLGTYCLDLGHIFTIAELPTIIFPDSDPALIESAPVNEIFPEKDNVT